MATPSEAGDGYLDVKVRCGCGVATTVASRSYTKFRCPDCHSPMTVMRVRTSIHLKPGHMACEQLLRSPRTE